MQKPFVAADILLPGADVSLERWAALACDQFTSQPDYWREAAAFTGSAPGALQITLPEVYLGQPDTPARIAAIHAAMREMRARVLTRAVRGFVYVERTTESGVRPGLVGAIDLECYSYAPGGGTAVRPSEATVTERIPPRLAVRRGASLETPHILMLADDGARRIVEPFAEKKASLEKLYDTPLMLGGGRVAGWAVTDPADIAAVEAAVAALGTQAAFDEKYPAAAGRAPLALAVGDGNHSLATAKAYWEEVKKALSPAQRAAHPARLCLAELVNIHCPALGFEPIHRVLFGVTAGALRDAFAAWAAAQAAREGAGQRFVFAGEGGGALTLESAPHPLAAGTLEAFLADWLPAHPGVRVDYIHGRDAVAALAHGDTAGVLLPDFARGDLFLGVALGGVLPKKTFSMGHAREKRYYLECRAL